jgi:hypothetical protein
VGISVVVDLLSPALPCATDWLVEVDVLVDADCDALVEIELLTDAESDALVESEALADAEIDSLLDCDPAVADALPDVDVEAGAADWLVD